MAVTMENVVEICVAIDIAILGIAYPIIVDKISNIGEKFSSEYVATIFNTTFPQKAISFKIFKRQFQLSAFKMMLFVTILFFPFLIFQLKPVLGLDNWLINNSAKLCVLITSTLLTVCFFIWLDAVILFNSKATILLKHIIAKYKQLKNSNPIRTDYLRAINELTIYAIEKQDEHLQKTLLEFYYEEFSAIRQSHNKDQPLIYPIELYFFVNKLMLYIKQKRGHIV